MQATMYIATLLLGIAAALITYFVTAALPGWLQAVLTGLAAMLPGGALTYVMLQRPLEQLSETVLACSGSNSLHQCPIDTTNYRHPLLQSLAGALRSMQSTVTESVSGIAERGGTLAIASAELSHSADNLKKGIEEQVQHARAIGSTSQQINETTHSMAQIAEQAEGAARATRDASQAGESTVTRTIEQIHRVRTEAESMAGILVSLQNRSQEIQGITQIIDQVAEQTNLLALNAAIEAARAGEHGRGFAVVADEVRQLASKTSAATREIASKLTGIYEEVNQSSNNMENLVKVVEGTVKDAGEVVSVLQNIFELSEQSTQGITQIHSVVGSHVVSINQITGSLGEVEQALSRTESEVEGVSSGALRLASTAEDEYCAVAKYEMGTLHDQVRHIAQDTAQRIGQLFEQAIEKGQISQADLMDRNYQAVAGTKPQKFSTRFDQFTDRVLPDIQEPILRDHPHIIYAGAVDSKGYFPTHNKRFSQPLTGDYEKDLSNNRTKRIFDDRTGSRCGSNTEPFLLQTYKRDTGEIMHDMSAPISIFGQHWGGFRIGYKSQA